MPDEQDSPWKVILEILLQPALEFSFPSVAAALDWSRPPEFIEGEILPFMRDWAVGKQYVDKLVKAWLLDGTEQWILVHIEVQHTRQAEFPERMYHYYTSLGMKHDHPIVTVAILADTDAGWRPSHYEKAMLGCRMRFDFPVCKLLDFDREELMRNSSPIALLVLANRIAQETKGDEGERFDWKIELTKLLEERGYSEPQTIDVFRLLDWLLALPEEKEQEFRREMERLERKDMIMTYRSSIERLARAEGVLEGRDEGRNEGRNEGREEGRQQAIRESIFEALDARFDDWPEALRGKVMAEKDTKRLRLLFQQALRCQSVNELIG